MYLDCFAWCLTHPCWVNCVIHNQRIEPLAEGPSRGPCAQRTQGAATAFCTGGSPRLEREEHVPPTRLPARSPPRGGSSVRASAN